MKFWADFLNLVKLLSQDIFWMNIFIIFFIYLTLFHKLQRLYSIKYDRIR